ncbi:MAG TPA: thioesterase family protein [Longimicrobiales bacterium]|nr:thioesterase family protein [Longimicrobiales bacterium]
MFESRFRVRSYELDAFGHVNHSVFFNYLEQAHFEALDQGGFPGAEIARRGWAVVVVHAEADFRSEARQGDELRVRTRVAAVRRTSMRVEQTIVREGDGALVAEGAVVAVWVGPDGRPMPVPEEVREALGATTAHP